MNLVNLMMALDLMSYFTENIDTLQFEYVTIEYIINIKFWYFIVIEKK